MYSSFEALIKNKLRSFGNGASKTAFHLIISDKTMADKVSFKLLNNDSSLLDIDY
jgi:hypothetical protein